MAKFGSLLESQLIISVIIFIYGSCFGYILVAFLEKKY